MAADDSDESDALAETMGDAMENDPVESLSPIDRADLARIVLVLAKHVRYGGFEVTFHESGPVDLKLTTRLRLKR